MKITVAFATFGTIAACAAALTTLGTVYSGAAESDARAEQFLPTEGFSYDLGRRLASGFYVVDHGQCSMTIVVSDKESAGTGSTRIRFNLAAGRQTNFAGEDLRSIRITCAPNAKAVQVERMGA